MSFDAFRKDSFFRGIVEAAPDGVVILSEGLIIFANGETEKLFGYARDELIGQPVELLIPERFRDVHRGHRDGYVQKPRPRMMGAGLNLTGRRKDGTEFPIEISLTPTQAAEGVFVTAAIRDATERTRAEAIIRELNADLEVRVKARTTQLEEANRLLDAVIENIPHVVSLKDAERLSLVLHNRACEEILGLPRAEVHGKSAYDLLPKDQADFSQASDREALMGLAIIDIPEQTVQTSRGLRLLHTIKVPLVDESGKPQYLLGISEDITDRKAGEVALARAKDAAEAANRELEAFSYSVAHDLRAPLRGMNGFAQLLVDSYSDKLDAEGQDWLSEILLNARRMGTLIDALLSLSRVTRSTLHRESVDLSAVARASASQLSTTEPHRIVEMVIEDQLHAELDPILARVLIDNLLDNAWKFTRKVPAARVELGAAEKDGVRAFYVRDNGAGFDMAFASKLFAPFQRLHAVDEFPGTGIGLATAQRIVQRHGGRLWAEGKVDGGATFYFSVFDRNSGELR